jgi:1-acyl-sn-glycerol-3-phosphate acyltransferase
MPELPPTRPYPAWARYFALPIGKFICRALFWIWGPITSRGAYRVPKKGALLVLANHQSDVDPIVVQVSCPRPVHFMAKSELFEMPILKWLIRIYQAFPVKRGEPDRASMRHAIELLKMGEAVSIFPEGELSEDGELLPMKPGIALIIRQAATPVICCGIRNSNKVMPYGKTKPRISGTRVYVEWGEVKEFTKESTTEEIIEWTAAQLRELSASPD